MGPTGQGSRYLVAVMFALGNFLSRRLPDSPVGRTGHKSSLLCSDEETRSSEVEGFAISMTLSCSLRLTLQPQTRMPLRFKDLQCGLKKQNANVKRWGSAIWETAGHSQGGNQGKSLNTSGPQSPHPQNGDNNAWPKSLIGRVGTGSLTYPQ